MHILSKVIASTSIIFFLIEVAAADDWVLRRQTTSGACHVQSTTVRPTLGNDLAGPYKSRKDACAKAKELYDSSATDSKKCASYGGGTVDACSKESVSLQK
jgi:hypothetical protein